MPNRILVIDDHEATRETLTEFLESDGHAVSSAATAAEARERIEAGGFDLVLSDLMLPDGNGLELMALAQERHPNVPYILVTGHGSIDNAIEATRRGAYDYIQKPVDLKRLRVTVRNALDLRSLRDSLGEKGALDAIIGACPAIRKLKETILQVARTDATVLIQGESGTGKELVANALQRLSDRHKGPYVRVNIAALPKDLLESELFGHEKGAFTGAIRMRQGRFELANGGTLFLDEIGEMPVETQVKLLRVLQERQIERVGGMETLPVDFRLVCATNADLKELIKESRFREDLFFRINVVNCRVPPLRERVGDLPLLCDYFLKRFCKHYNLDKTFGKDALDAMAAYSWPGNVRELENAVERAVVMSPETVIRREDLSEDVTGASGTSAQAGGGYAPGMPMEEVEKRHILATLDALGGNKTRTASALGIGVKTLYRKLEAWGIPLA